MPKLNQYPARRSVLVLDNCSIHKDSANIFRLRAICGVHIIFLPPYTPWFNPVEEVFGLFKNLLRQNGLRYYSGSDVPGYLRRLLFLLVTRELALKLVERAGYVL